MNVSAADGRVWTHGVGKAITATGLSGSVKSIRSALSALSAVRHRFALQRRPPIAQLRTVARAIAIAVVRHARDSGDGRQYTDEEIEQRVDRAMWWRAYLPFEAAEGGLT